MLSTGSMGQTEGGRVNRIERRQQMSCSNEKLVKLWVAGIWGRSNRMISFGDNLYSYALLIGYTNREGEKVALDYTAGSGHYKSNTTSHHVALAKQYADKTEVPS